MSLAEQGRTEVAIDDLSALVPDLFRLVLEQSATALCLVSADGRFLTVNPAACTLLGRSKDELLHCSFQELTHSDDLDVDEALARRVMAGELDTYRLAKRYLHPDGAVVYGRLTVTGVRDATGEFLCFVSEILDVTGATHSQEAARIAQAQLRGVIDSQLDPWVLWQAIRDVKGSIVDFRYVDANAAACAANGLDRHQLLGRTLLELFPEHGVSGLLGQYADVVRTGAPLALDDHPFHALDQSGRVGTRWFDNRATKVDDGISFTWRDVTDRVVQRQRLAEAAFRDPLTGLANRAQLDARLAQTSERRQAGRIDAVIYCDLDRLKSINDTWGHEAGDTVLMAVATRMREAVRVEDLVARVGGDEFVVVAGSLGTLSDAHLLAGKITQAVSRPLRVRGSDMVPSISVGIAIAEQDEDPSSTLRRADLALYHCKSQRDGIPPTSARGTPRDASARSA